MAEQEIKKPRIKKHYAAIIFWSVLIIFAYFSARYITYELDYKKAQKAVNSQFTNLESKIYQTTLPDNTTDQAKPNSDILLKQQMQISELQNNYNNLRFELERLKTGDSLPKIILTFVELRDLIDTGSNYQEKLQKLEVLCGRDIALSNKIAQLKFFLQNKPKNSAQIAGEFSSLIPEIIAKKIELNNNQNWWGKTKAVIARFITVRRVDGSSQTAGQNVDSIIMQSKNLIAKKQYGATLKILNSLGSDYQPLLVKLNFDLQNADGLQQISGEIYEYLKTLSNS